jgi:decaprenylphospho-beta-D-ribofuranose 2-oxidase
MEQPKQKIVTGFGLFKSVNTLVATPKNLDDLAKCIDFAKQKKFKIAIQGGGNSYSDVFFNNQLVIDTKQLNSIKSFDSENGQITVEPGVRIGDLLDIIMPHNWILVGLSGSVNDVIGGMLSTNVHGKDSWKNGNFSQNIISFKIMLANGTTEIIKNDNRSELFNSIVGGLGFLGLITEITLELKPIPSYMVQHQTQRIPNLEKLVDFFYSLEENGLEYAHALLNPFASGGDIGQGISDSCRFVNEQNCSEEKFKEFLVKKPRVYMLKPKNFWSLCKLFWNNNTNRIICDMRYRKTPTSYTENTIPFPKYQYPHSAKPNFNLLFTPSGFFEIQTIFTRDIAIQAFTELLSLSRRFRLQPFICGIKRHKSDSSYLSFANDGLSITMNFSLNVITTEQRDEYCKELTNIILKHEGKTYLAKHPYFSQDDFQRMYPNYKKILELKAKYDPDCLFLSGATKRLLID